MSARWWLSRRPPRPPIPRRKCALVLMSLLACHATSPHTNAIEEEPTNLRFGIKHGNMTTRHMRLASSDQINPTLTQYPQRYVLRNTHNSAPSPVAHWTHPGCPYCSPLTHRRRECQVLRRLRCRLSLLPQTAAPPATISPRLSLPVACGSMDGFPAP